MTVIICHVSFSSQLTFDLSRTPEKPLAFVVRRDVKPLQLILGEKAFMVPGTSPAALAYADHEA